MSIEANKTLMRRYYEEVLNQGHLEALAELAEPHYVEHNPLPGQGTGRAGLHNRVAMIRQAFQPHFTIEDLVAEAEKVAVRWTHRGTHVGEFMGLPPSGRAFTIAGVDIYVVREGQMIEHWDVIDQLSFLQQVGVLGQGAPAGAA